MRLVFPPARLNAMMDRILGHEDAIFGFEHGIDKVDLSDIDANTTRRGDQAFHLQTGDHFTRAGQLIFQDRELSGEVNGDGKADFVLYFGGSFSITGTDVIL